jgi:hypothetical protein
LGHLDPKIVAYEAEVAHFEQRLHLAFELNDGRCIRARDDKIIDVHTHQHKGRGVAASV